MILTLLGVALLTVGVIGLYIAKEDYSKDWAFYTGFLGTMFGGILLFGCVLVIILTHAQQHYRIQESDLQRETIELQLKNAMDSSDTLAQNKAIDKASRWNIRVFKTKTLSENLWVNWFYDKEWADSLKYIEVEDNG